MKHYISQKNFDKAIELGIYEVTSELPLCVTHYKACGRTENLQIEIV